MNARFSGEVLYAVRKCLRSKISSILSWVAPAAVKAQFMSSWSSIMHKLLLDGKGNSFCRIMLTALNLIFAILPSDMLHPLYFVPRAEQFP